MPLTIVTYHYVRDLPRSRYPAIKARLTADFEGQLAYLARHYQFVRREQVLAALAGAADALPENGVVLTFDDGYIDHYATVFPILHDRGIEGWFFPAARPVLEGRVLDVNKVHFVLAAGPGADLLARHVDEAVRSHRDAFDLAAPDVYRAEFARPSRFDPAEVVYVKRMLQKALPEELRSRIADALFRRYVTEDEAGFAAELYCSLDQLRLMLRGGMYVGAHGYGHYWMDRLAAAEQESEIRRSLDFLALLGAPRDGWVACYPYGAHDAALRAALRRHGCAVGLTTRPALVSAADDPLALPRLDTNDLPVRAGAGAAGWTEMVRQ